MMDRRLFSLLLLHPLAASFGRAQETRKPDLVEYTAFDGKKSTLQAWRGRKVAILTKPGTVDPQRMAELCEIFDKVMESLVDLYEADASLTWENTLKIDAAPKNPLGLNGTDLFASFCLRLAKENGGLDFVKRLWKAAGDRPAARSTLDAVDNFVIAASQAARRDLGPPFADRWRWPVSPQGRKAAAESAAGAES